MEDEMSEPEFDDWLQRIANCPTTPRGKLDSWKCSTPDCDCKNRGRMLLPVCHPDASVVAAYVMAKAKVVLCCSECGRTFLALRVAPDA